VVCGGGGGVVMNPQAVPAAVLPSGSDSVPNWPILRPHNSKGPSKNVNGCTNMWQNFCLIFPEMAEKGPKY